jgi:uncharacterized protein
MNSTTFIDRHPYWVAVLLFLTTFFMFLVSGVVVTIMKLPPESLYIIAFVLLALICAVLLTKNDWWHEIGFRSPYERRLLWLFWLPFVPVVGNLLGSISMTDSRQVLLFFVMAILSGFVEETIFRGMILRDLLPTGIWRAALISALLFGVMHILNVLSISSPAYALLQVGYAIAIGFGYAALVIRTGTIWPLILAHSLTNFTSFIAAGGAGEPGPVTINEMVLAAVYIVLFSAYGVYLLRSQKNREVVTTT